MFALLLPGSPLLSPSPISPTQFAFRFSPSTKPNHLAVFLLPAAAFPPGTAATVWIQLPPSTEFKLLGALTAGKPSAIYRLNDGAVAAGGEMMGSVDAEGDVMVEDDTATSNGAGNATSGAEIVVGVQVEDEAQVAAQISQLRTRQQGQAAPTTTALTKTGPTSRGATGSVETKVLAQRIIQNAFNFLSSFGSDTIPLKAFQDWWKKFEGKIERDPGFLEREQ